MTTDLGTIINVSVIPGVPGVAEDNMNVVAVFTSERGPLNSRNRYELFTTPGAVADRFGSSAAITEFGNNVLSQAPNPTGARGFLVAAYWRATEEELPATAAELVGGELTEETVVDILQEIEDGEFAITVNGGVEQEITGLDFSAVTDLGDVLEVLQGEESYDEIQGATVELRNGRIAIISDSTGDASTLTYLSPVEDGEGTFIGNVLALAEGSGAVLTQGEDADILPAESKLDALAAVKALVNFKGGMFIAAPTDGEREGLAAWAQANNTLLYDVFSSSSHLEINKTNVAWRIRQQGYSNYRMLFSHVGNRKFASAYMGRNHVVNFAADSTAITMNLKRLVGVMPEQYTAGELVNAGKIGLDVYTTFKLSPAVIAASGNDFVDNRYNLLAFVDSAQTQLFNILYTAGTKIGQTDSGVQTLIDQGERVSRQFVNAGVFAPGAWTRPDFFGDKETFHRAIEEFGYYWLAGSLADQPASDRAERLSPPLQCAVKNKGAIHKGDVIINFDL